MKNLGIERDGRVAVVRLATGTPQNALSVAAMHELLAAAEQLEHDAALSAVVLTGTADCFSLGFDLRDGAALVQLPLAERREALAVGPRMCSAWERIEALTVAAIEGWCVGGGLALAAALDLRVAGAGARFYVPEIERGMNMSWGSLPRLVNLVGPARAKRMVMLAEQADAARAEAWGLVDECVPEGQALARARALAARAAAMPPVPLRMCKQGINAYANALAATASALDRDQFLLAQQSEDFREGIASFLEKRPARFEGR